MEQVPRWEKDLPRHTWAVDSGCAQAMLMAAQATFTMEAEAALEELEGGTEDALVTFMEVGGMECVYRCFVCFAISSWIRAKFRSSDVIVLVVFSQQENNYCLCGGVKMYRCPYVQYVCPFLLIVDSDFVLSHVGVWAEVRAASAECAGHFNVVAARDDGESHHARFARPRCDANFDQQTRHVCPRLYLDCSLQVLLGTRRQAGSMIPLVASMCTSRSVFTLPCRTVPFHVLACASIEQMSVSLGEFTSSHSYEYCGNVARLVLTPLTDRCYLALTAALRLNLGAALSGPTGLGKGATVRELAKMLGTFCVSFNCSDDFDSQSITRGFSGIAQCGAWGIFQEVNCLNHGTLSMMAQMLKQVLDAIARFASPANREEEYESLPEGTPNVKVLYNECMYCNDNVVCVSFLFNRLCPLHLLHLYIYFLPAFIASPLHMCLV